MFTDRIQFFFYSVFIFYENKQVLPVTAEDKRRAPKLLCVVLQHKIDREREKRNVINECLITSRLCFPLTCRCAEITSKIQIRGWWMIVRLFKYTHINTDRDDNILMTYRMMRTDRTHHDWCSTEQSGRPGYSRFGTWKLKSC